MSLEERLKGIIADAYGIEAPVFDVLEVMTDEEIQVAMSDTLESLLQEGRIDRQFWKGGEE